MNRIEYLRGLEHRQRLAGMVEMARKTMSPEGFLAFSQGIDYQSRALEDELTAYERSESAQFCKWMGMKIYTISTGPLPGSAKPCIADMSVAVGETEIEGELALNPA